MAMATSDKSQGKPLFLIVEDHDVLRKSLCDLISAHFPESRVMDAGNGERGIAVALDQGPDIVLMDIRLPKISGIEATREIKTVCPGARVIMLTICESPEYRADAAASGASAYVPKRKMGSDLIPTIHRLLGEGDAAAAGFM